MSLANEIVRKMESLRHSHYSRKETIQLVRNDITYAKVDEIAEVLVSEGYEVTYEIGTESIYMYISW